MYLFLRLIRCVHGGHGALLHLRVVRLAGRHADRVHAFPRAPAGCRLGLLFGGSAAGDDVRPQKQSAENKMSSAWMGMNLESLIKQTLFAE